MFADQPRHTGYFQEDVILIHPDEPAAHRRIGGVLEVHGHDLIFQAGIERRCRRTPP
jgi:hypothetical protein